MLRTKTIFGAFIFLISSSSICFGEAPKPESLRRDQNSFRLKSVDREFFLSVSEGDIKSVKIFLNSGTKVDLKDEDGRTALMIAAQKGHIDLVKLLLARGADRKIFFKDHLAKKSKNARDLAADSGHAMIVDLLK